MSKTAKRPAIHMPSAEEDRGITAAAKAASKKLLVSVRYSPEVIDYFKSTGEGWQARMDGVLQRYVARHSREG